GGGDAMSQMKMDKEMNLGDMGLLLPKTSVSVGDTWTANNKFSLDMETSGMTIPINATVDNTYKLESVETMDGKKMAKIAINTKIDGTMEAMGQPGTIKGTTMSTVWFDIDGGIITKIEVNSKVTNDMAGMVTIDQTAKSTTTFTRSK